MKQVVLKSAFTALWVLLVSCWCSLSSAEIFTVNTFQDTAGADCSSGLCSLRSAIQQANILPNDDTIVLAEGTYKITRTGILEEEAAVGDLDITENLTIRGAGRSKTIINGNQIDRIFDIKNSASVDIDGVTIRNGFTQDASNGIVAWGSGAMLGGGIALSENSSLIITNCILADNKTLTDGGAISGKGSNLTIDNCIIDNNTAASGGGISMRDSGSAKISNSTLSNNYANYSGAGFFNMVPYVTHTITNSLFYANHAGGGSAISTLATGAILRIDNSTISGNTSVESDAIYLLSSAGTYINNSTIVNNKGEKSAGIGGIGRVFVSNSILANNTNASGVSLDCSVSEINSLGHNIIGSNNGCNVSATTGDIIGTQTAPINPMLASLANNGGATLTHSLLSGSVAIDAGNTAVAGSGGSACEFQDQRGINRINGGRCDIGAYELTSNADLSVVITQASGSQTSTDILKLLARIHNDGPDNSNNLSLKITLPVGAEYQNSIDGEWDCTAIANSFTCKRLLLLNTGKSDLIINFWPPNGVNPMVMTASIESSTVDLNSSNNTSKLVIDSESNTESDEDTGALGNADESDLFADDENKLESDANNTANIPENSTALTSQNNISKFNDALPHDWDVDIHATGVFDGEIPADQWKNSAAVDVSQFEKSWLTMDGIKIEENIMQSELFKFGAGAVLFAGAVALYVNSVTFFGIFFSFPLWSLFDPTPVTLLSLSGRRQHERKEQKLPGSEGSGGSVGRILDDDMDAL